ncbi:hypothetical protein QTA58_05085 [Neorhizobium sp. CSC1952]|uniref:hypothetical protein n=1 Tax=Neorhizobium sp. CSC1952 TaxID=2978974 RepID=UPI0025A4EBA5|nr:hypothetical protein [Rhizobium sp. CSC1952]WJR68135.1 hypothetical protein QTA58_05085 [Rhizobium sp. CSC1952]
MTDVNELLDSLAAAAVEQKSFADLLGELQQRPDGLYDVPAAAWSAYAESLEGCATREGALRWFNNLLASTRAEQNAQAAGLSGADLEIAAARKIAANRANINAALAANY